MSTPQPSPEPDARARPQQLEVRGLTVRFGGVTPVDNVSFTISPGEIVGLIGPNGAGKSTLIDTITGFVKPLSGSVLLGGVDLTEEPVHRRVHAGLVPIALEVFRYLLRCALSGRPLRPRWICIARDRTEVHPKAHTGFRDVLTSDRRAGLT